ncbi:NADH dehydrogenase [ubiquinone] iron-sulfur protein 4, mitochondrial [Scaptodrosophila lebanonensis]|uniref:NADH dehydrogenase [ubiquinone] iron-sulfur protein 4, mitochondrial n=1 Tax=Drosophila lebanonensis TaxID=7225 RepID=A0A6J2U1M7_DROLE|nr:NADH dehydrogenase [ubiquinone] iron-sulfur protein 4, mitochondrial [Scaptodrosophila lebanonensis]
MSGLSHIMRQRPFALQMSASKVANVLVARWASSQDIAPMDLKSILARPEEVEQRNKLSGKITVPKAVNLSPISGVPSDHIRERRVRIHIPPKNAMQSGTDNLQTWQIEFDNRERWENPLMGWTSTGDPLSNMNVQFGSKDEAITYCERNGWRWYVDSEQTKKERVKNYGVNFSWNKRTRVSTK